jgi:hypothetical protein
MQTLKSLHNTTNIYVKKEYCIHNIDIISMAIASLTMGQIKSDYYKILKTQLDYYNNYLLKLKVQIRDYEQLHFRFGAS